MEWLSVFTTNGPQPSDLSMSKEEEGIGFTQMVFDVESMPPQE